MRKKIDVDSLVVGMYLQEIEGAWIANPFWRKSFLLESGRDIALIRASTIREVWIDTARGLDVPQPAGERLEADVPVHVVEQARPDLGEQPVSMAEELRRATRICADSKQAVANMFQEARMGNTVDAAGVGRLVQEISDSVARHPDALISLARLKTADDYTYMHSVAVCAMMIALARQLGLNEADTRAAGIAGLVHDMGKAMLPMSVLNKPGKLTPSEFAIVKSHPELGHGILQRGGNADAMALDVCLHHHERIDGTGYPNGLRADQISLHARMAAVCDVYDAITSNRPYKTGWDPAESMRKMAEWAGTHFDVQVFQAFAKSLGIYPVGSLVRLSSGHIGVVSAQGGKSLTQPVVQVFYSTKTNQRVPPLRLNLSDAGCTDTITAREDPTQWQFADVDDLWQAD